MNINLIKCFDIEHELINGVKLGEYLQLEKFKSIEKFKKHNLSATLNHDEVNSEITRQLKIGAISIFNGETPWIHPLSLVRKSDGRPRLCIDLSRGTNRITKDIKFDFPNGPEIIRNQFANNKKGAGVIDLKDGFFHIKIHHEHRKYFAFRWENINYVYNRLPFGWKLSPFIFQKFLEKIIKDKNAFNYMDDIIIFDKKHYNQIEKRLIKLGLTINYDKTRKFSNTQIWVGYQFKFTKEGIIWSIPKEKIKKFLSLKNSNRENIALRLASMINFYDRMIPKLRIIKYNWYKIHNSKNRKFSKSLWKKTWRVINNNYLDSIIKKFDNIIIADASEDQIATLKIVVKNQELEFSKIRIIKNKLLKKIHISTKEALAVSSLDSFGNTLVITDNASVFNIINSGKSPIPFFQKWIRNLRKKKKILFPALVKSHANFILDFYSRNKINRLKFGGAVEVSLDLEGKKFLSENIKKLLKELIQKKIFSNQKSNLKIDLDKFNENSWKFHFM